MNKPVITLRDMADEAKEMMRQNPEMGWVHRKLTHGLEFVLQRKGPRWRLAFARQDTFPSEVEAKVIRNAFGVPAPIEHTQSTKEYTYAKSGRHVTFYRIECEWIDYQEDHAISQPVAA